ncbi:hypothetical protein K9L67_04500 [Candidatus Woesearchaeota archaeon]|nr:hypothetical protein [Candidatus Woesearchaeota archaeon]MCF7901460.1 hypothetical protein [Candidatus Woesearchaeota archaeon]MCF8013545.1 hypothetical protein [Candidatus Woesearchaeota archaeon]
MNKKAMEMSINAIVAIVLALMMFGAGIFLFQNIIDDGKDLWEQADQQLLDKARDLADDGQPVVVFPKTIDVRDEDQYIVYLGVKNIFNEKVNVSVSLEKMTLDNETTFNDQASMISVDKEEYAAHESKSYAMVVNTDKIPKGSATQHVSVQWFESSTSKSIKVQNVLVYINKK